jgi:hypothetical protein
MYRPSLWFVALSTILLTAALLAGKSYLLVPAAGSCILLGYGYAVVRQTRKARNAYLASGEEMRQVERQRYLLAKEAILDGAKRKRLRKQPRKQE